MTAVLFEDPLGIPLPWFAALPPLGLEARRRSGRQLRYPAERACGEEDAGRVLETLHPEPRRVERRAYGHRPVVREQPRVVLGQVGLDLISQLSTPRGAVRDERHAATLQDKLG